MTPKPKTEARQWNADAGERCASTAFAFIDGRSAGVIRCGRWAEHDGSHVIQVDFSWQDADAPDWPEAHDPDESFDVEVDLEPHGLHDLDDVLDDLGIILGDEACGAAWPSDPTRPCTLPRGHLGAHDLAAVSAEPSRPPRVSRLDALLDEAAAAINRGT